MMLSTPEVSQFGARRIITDVPVLGIAACLVVVAMQTFAPAARAEVFGLDNRKPVAGHATRAALTSKIGALTNRKTRALCTAFCVRADVIATAAHCLYGPEASIADTTFHLDGLATRIAGHADPVAHVIAGTMDFSLRPPINATSDWALAKLPEPLCKAGGLWFSRKTATELTVLPKTQPLFQAGFHIDKTDDELLISTPCTAPPTFSRVGRDIIEHDYGRVSSLILHTCDTGPGSSGSPIMIEGVDGVEVVGINIGTYIRERQSPPSKILQPRQYRDAISNTGVSVSELRDRIADLDQLDLVRSRAELRDMQILMAAEGWYGAAIDGNWTAALRSAIESYERSEGLPERGIPDVKTLTALRTRKSARTVETGSVNQRLR